MLTWQYSVSYIQLLWSVFQDELSMQRHAEAVSDNVNNNTVDFGARCPRHTPLTSDSLSRLLWAQVHAALQKCLQFPPQEPVTE